MSSQEALERHVKGAPDLPLKPNRYLRDPGIPYLYQRRASLLMVARPRMVLGDDVGLGKTLEAIVALTYLKARDPAGRILVCTEKSTLRQWQREFAWLAPDVAVEVATADTIPGRAAKERYFSRGLPDAVVTTYATMREYLDPILAGLGDAPLWAVFDEPPFREPGRATSKAGLKLSRAAERVYGLTATVVEGRLEEAYGIFNVIAPGAAWRSKKQFLELHCVTQPIFRHREFPRRVVKYVNLAEFRGRIEPYFYGRLSTHPEVKQDLPDVVTKDVPIAMGAWQTERVMDAVEGVLSSAKTDEKIDLLASLIRAQEMANWPGIHGWPDELKRSAKAEALLEMLQNSLSGERVLVYSKSRKTVEALHRLLAGRKIRAGTLVGGQSTDERAAVVDAFMSDDNEIDVLLLTKAGGRALNLQRGGHLICFDTPWTYGQYRQLVGRIRRTGSSHRAVVVWRFLAELDRQTSYGRTGHRSWSTIDHHCLRHVKRGKRVFDAVTGDVEGIETTPADAKAILEDLRRAYARGEDFMRSDGVDLGEELTL